MNAATAVLIDEKEVGDTKHNSLSYNDLPRRPRGAKRNSFDTNNLQQYKKLFNLLKYCLDNADIYSIMNSMKDNNNNNNNDETCPEGVVPVPGTQAYRDRISDDGPYGLQRLQTRRETFFFNRNGWFNEQGKKIEKPNLDAES